MENRHDGENVSFDLFKGNSVAGILLEFSEAAVEFGGLLKREFVVKFFTKLCKHFALFFKRKFVQLL